MQDRVRHRATYADLEAVPPHLVAELLHGELITHPRPRGSHSEVHFALGGELSGPFRKGTSGPGGWRFLTEPELHLGDEVVVPDLAGWRIERIAPPPEPDPLAPVSITLVPDWACEVLSPSTERHDRGTKRQIYAAAGVRHLWLVDPRIELVEVFALADDGWRLVITASGHEAKRMPPFDAIELALDTIWPPSRGAGESSGKD